MIAHRLQTIQTAQNLLYINNPQEVIAAEKGTPQYNDIMMKLKAENYKHQEGLESPTKNKEDSDEDLSVEFAD
jgi:hypothetical protein